jgi:hypothetical protein
LSQQDTLSVGPPPRPYPLVSLPAAAPHFSLPSRAVSHLRSGDPQSPCPQRSRRRRRRAVSLLRFGDHQSPRPRRSRHRRRRARAGYGARRRLRGERRREAGSGERRLRPARELRRNPQARELRPELAHLAAWKSPPFSASMPWGGPTSPRSSGRPRLRPMSVTPSGAPRVPLLPRPSPASGVARCCQG